MADLKVVFRGRSAHAGNNPQDGANANVAAMRFSLACYELADPAKGTTVNPGIIAGGTATNVIPDSCEVRFDLRYCFDKDGSDLENQIFELAERSWAPGVSQTVELLGFTPAMPLSDDAKALTAKITEAAKMTGFEAKFVDAGGGSDGNRIAKGKFTLFGEEHELTINNGPNSLHGGPTGFHARVWDAIQLDESTVQFNYVSADGEEGFPGNLEVEMTYRLENEVNALTIEYRATTDKATVVNLTNHGFFNLAGISTPTPTVNDHIVTINADFYTPIDEVSIPTGEIAKVEGTPMDFRTPHTVGERINDKFQQLIFGAGYDHCYVLNKIESGSLDLAATCKDPKSGRIMEVYTTEAGVQLYTGNWLNGFEGAHGATFPARSAICFEAQCFPDTPNKPHFPSATLLPGDEYQQITVYKFAVEE